MVNIQGRLARFIAPKYIKNLEESKINVQQEINMRVAEAISKMDPFEPLMRQFNGTFSEEYERPEDKLNPRGQLSMKMWGYTQNKDPNFEYFIDWIMNTHANETLKRAPVTTERILYGRAQISAMILFKTEVKRLSNLYEEMLENNKIQSFDSTKAVE